MSDTAQFKSTRLSQDQTEEVRGEPLFQYQMDSFKGMKIAILITFGKLPYFVQVLADTDQRPFVLKTSQGTLTQEYQIVSYIVNDCFLRGSQQREESQNGEDRPKLWVDILTWARMNEQLFLLRNGLFPMLQELQSIMFGHKKVRKSYYDALGNKIRKKILELDQNMSEHNEIFVDYSFLNIIIVCELYLACRFFFEEKFRKTRIRFFSKCQKIYNSAQFEEVYGKYVPCKKELIPAIFEEEEEPEHKREEMLQLEITKNFQPWISPSGNEMRNELLYNFFRETFKGQQSKLNYFPYYWLMYDNLLCSLVEIKIDEHIETYAEMERTIELGAQQMNKILKNNVDYGFLGLYLNQKEKKHYVQGLVCLADQSFQTFAQEFSRNSALRQFRVNRMDIQSEEERRKVQIMWQYQAEGGSFEGVKVALIRQL